MANLILSKESSSNELKGYFEAVLKLSQTDNEFPINLDDVWMLVYSRRDKSVSTLKKDFIEGVDYVVFPQKVENPKGGRPTDKFMLSVPCLEYFIARKVRPVFDVYRQVFHKTATMYARKEIVYVEREENVKLLKEVQKKNKDLERELWETKARLEIKQNLLQSEMDLKNSCFGFLVKNRMYERWQSYNESLVIRDVVNRLKREKEIEETRPYELPF